MGKLKSNKKLFVAVSIVTLVFAFNQCKHDPFPGPPDNGNGNQNPIDTVDPNNGKPCDPDTIYFQRDVQPILSANCAYAGCHNSTNAQDGVILSDYNSVINTGDVRAGDLDGSDLYEVITETNPDKVMPPPPNNRLSAANIEIIRKWILQGAQNLTCDDCDTVNLTYSNRIQTIITQNCLSCHGATNPNAGRSLTNYTEVKEAMLNTAMLNRIKGASGVPVMPPAGRMNDCNVRSIEKWFNEGMIE